MRVLSFIKGDSRFNFDHVWKDCETWMFSLFGGVTCPVNLMPSIKKKINQVEFSPSNSFAGTILSINFLWALNGTMIDRY